MAVLKPNANNSGLRGRMQGQVYSGGGEDTIVRSYTKKTAEPTPAQQAQEARFTQVSQGWGDLPQEARDAWDLAARDVLSKNPRRTRPKPISGFNLYLSLGSTFLMASPGNPVPQYPPATRFTGDPLQLSLSSGMGSLVLTTNGVQGNRPGVRTEILVQRLAAAYRKPRKDGYVTKAIVALEAAPPATSYVIAPGVYSVAVRFIEVASGRTAGFRVLGTTTVSLSMVDGGLADEGSARQAA